MSGQPTKQVVENWANELEQVGRRIGHHFARSEPRKRAIGYLRGLLSDTVRKNGGQLAEYLGEATPHAVQHLLGRADWDADAVRDDLIDYVHEHLGAPDRVSIVDETGFLQKGTKSCGAARQFESRTHNLECSRHRRDVNTSLTQEIGTTTNAQSSRPDNKIITYTYTIIKHINF